MRMTSPAVVAVDGIAIKILLRVRVVAVLMVFDHSHFHVLQVEFPETNIGFG